MNFIEHYNFKNKKVLIRVDFNVPLNSDFQITDDSRITAALPTIRKVLQDGGSAILMSHLGRPKEGPADKFSLRHLMDHLSTLLNLKVRFAEDCIGDQASKLAQELNPGDVLLLENLRFYKEEEKGDRNFAEKLAKLGDFYVNDAFGTAHRAHASTAIIADFFKGHKCFGYIMAKEIENADKVMKSPQRPFTAIVGGAKVSDKILIIENLLQVADHIIIGGGMTYTFIKAMGGKIGNSLFEEERVQLTREILSRAKEKGVQIHLPTDSVAADKFANDARTANTSSDDIEEGYMGLDIGEKAIEDFRKVILESKTILWNGPMGVFEMSSFENGTKQIALALAEATRSGSFTLIGGGDSAAAISKFNLTGDVSYVSTGGGALLEYFEGKELPGIKAIND
ncbi:MAG: phosphoglycerate kinase [Flavobacteriales bacterium]|nr:phosphoglycerate kinase [Flavobacteriales bacterium]